MIIPDKIDWLDCYCGSIQRFVFIIKQKQHGSDRISSGNYWATALVGYSPGLPMYRYFFHDIAFTSSWVYETVSF